MKRKILQNLISWKNNKDRKPLILKGVRQVGKTYLLKEFGKKHFVNYHYLNFERDKKLSNIFQKDLNPQRIIEEICFYLDTKINLKKDFLIFDEIQECPNALTSLKYFNEELPGIYLCGAGSLLGLCLGNSSFPVGKVDFLTLYPMSFEEFLESIDKFKLIEILNNFKEKGILEIAHEKLWEYLKHYFIIGGMPEVVDIYRKNKQDLYKTFELARIKQENLILAYFADMTKHSGSSNAMHLNRLFKSVPAQLEKTTTGSANKFKFKGIVPGISHYNRLVTAIDWLENMGLIIKVHIVDYAKEPISAYYKENAFKLFLFDIGILGKMCDLSPKSILDYNYGSYKGYFAENFVLQELLCSGLKSLFCWHEKMSEIEFLINKDESTIPIEVKAGKNTKSKSLNIFDQKYSPKYSIILSSNQYKFIENKKIFYLPLYLTGKIFKGSF